MDISEESVNNLVSLFVKAEKRIDELQKLVQDQYRSMQLVYEDRDNAYELVREAERAADIAKAETRVYKKAQEELELNIWQANKYIQESNVKIFKLQQKLGEI